jgi:hypothetical protein
MLLHVATVGRVAKLRIAKVKMVPPVRLHCKHTVLAV